jgi:hypothetical protein
MPRLFAYALAVPTQDISNKQQQCFQKFTLAYSIETEEAPPYPNAPIA